MLQSSDSRLLKCGVALAALCVTAPVYAQDTSAQTGTVAEDKADIVVTGTLIRGLTPVKPPVNITTFTGYGPGNIIGRTIQLGLRKKF